MANHFNEIKKTVSFIFIENEKKELVPNGTGFFVGIKKKSNPEISYAYLVTAKHVLQDRDGKYLSEIILRLNKQKGDSEIIRIPRASAIIYEHPDPNVDIAVFPCLPNQEKFDFTCIPEEIIASKKIIQDNEIAEGDDVFFTGLFTSHIGQKRNQPIVRFGRVALMPEEKIEWKESNKPVKQMDLYLLECQSFGGNSGSPVFFQLSPLRKPGVIMAGGAKIFLAGVMTGSYQQGNRVLATNVIPNLIALQNAGIAAVTPADKLHEILFSPEMVKSRQD